MNQAAKEVVYVNGGELYKTPTDNDLGQKYVPDASADPIFPFTKVDGKRYLFTTEFKQFFGGGVGQSLANYDLCPAVNLWICLAAVSPEKTQNFDLYFATESSAQLKQVADYYGLPYPINDEIAQAIDTRPEEYLFWNAGGKPIVPGGIKFIDGVPAILKLYTYPKPFGSWDVWMYGMSYYNGGECFEAGAVYQKLTGGEDLPRAQMRGKGSFRKAEVIYSERADGVRTSYAFVNSQDPVMFWEGHQLNAKGETFRVKHFESARWVRQVICRLNAGSDFDDRLHPAAGRCLGRAWYDRSTEEELFFAVTGTDQLDALAQVYGLPVPYNQAQKAILDSNPELYRARHYDLLGLGEGNYVNVVVGSVTFVAGEPKRLLLYTFLRPWDFAEPIELPKLIKK